MIKGIHHKAFHVVDMDRSLEFYCDTLGFQKAFELHESDGSPWIVYIKIAEGSFIELFYGGTESEKPQLDHICFEVEDIRTLAEQLKEQGIPFAADLSQGKDLNWQFWIKDPDGNWLEFMEINPESPQMNS
ncbi:VOC family protein [Alkalicoccus daliensis]|nr:VOC family protein [Alkalicoccus daliensis]